MHRKGKRLVDSLDLKIFFGDKDNAVCPGKSSFWG
jgi:hypothetical protein